MGDVVNINEVIKVISHCACGKKYDVKYTEGKGILADASCACGQPIVIGVDKDISVNQLRSYTQPELHRDNARIKGFMYRNVSGNWMFKGNIKGLM